MIKIKRSVAIGLGNLAFFALRLLGRNASTLPGRIMRAIDPSILSYLTKDLFVTVVTGTNGKTTTVAMIVHILESSGRAVLSNPTGANLASGLTTILLRNRKRKIKECVLEVDEAVFAAISDQLNPRVVLVTNVFRDQLDRYGEMYTVYTLIKKGLEKSSPEAVILCGDDPLVASLADVYPDRSIFFGIAQSAAHDSGNKFAAGVDEGNCPRCQSLLEYRYKTIGHLGRFNCPNCTYTHPNLDYSFSMDKGQLSICEGELEDLVDKNRGRYREISFAFDLPGQYNAYNACSASATALTYLSVVQSEDSDLSAVRSLMKFKPSFGRMERIPVGAGYFCLILVKNPVGYQQALELLGEADDVDSVLLLLNNNLADGRDVSWIWDVPFEQSRLPQVPLAVSGVRGTDLALRLQYSGYEIDQSAILGNAIPWIKERMEHISDGKCLYILPNYTAMLELRGQLAKAFDFNRDWVK